MTKGCISYMPGPMPSFDGLQMANRFYETGLFEYAEPDFRPLDMLHSATNDPLYPLQWGLKNTGSAQQFNGTPGADIGIEAAWQITKGSPSIRIAVIDEGVQRLHPDLVNNIDPMGFGLVAANATTGEVLAGNLSHGTSCAGIIAARADNGIGVAGVAPLSKIIPVNLTVNSSGNFGSFEQIASCIDWAWNQGGADILSNSWNITLASNLVNDAIKRAATLGRGGKGALVLFSSGNDDAGLNNPKFLPEVIAVGAMSMCYQRKSVNSCDGENFWGSNYGVGLDISAPGVKIATTMNGGYTETFNGTSSACPFAAGVAALILSINPNYTYTQAREILERSARKVGNYTYSRVPDQPNGSWNSELGYGMVNAHQAVLAAQGFDFNCKVSIAANGPTQFCTGSAVNLSVTNPTSGSAYNWLRNGIAVQNGQNLSATTSGLYQAVMVRSGGCRDTSIGIEVRVATAAGTLQARAGRDTVICPLQTVILGGSPSGMGGTALFNPLRGMAHDYDNNLLLRFNPQNPSTEFKVVRQAFASGNQIFAGAAVTPNGVYMVSNEDRFVKVDTATGQLFDIGTATIPNVWTGMTYNPLHQKIYGVSFGGSANQLYEIDSRTATPTLLGTIANTNGFILRWLAADANGDMYAMSAGPPNSSGHLPNSTIFKINITPPSATALPSGTGFAAHFSQDAEFDPISGKLLVFARTNSLNTNRGSFGNGLWEANKVTGVATLIGAVGQERRWLDALAFAGPEYRYSWSPTQYLSNPNDANPVFSGAPPGVHTYTLTVTDLCGRTAQSTVSVTVSSSLAPNASGVLFVNAEAGGNGSGSSWANAVPSLQQALLNLSSTCGTISQIWVAKGTYKPTTGTNRDLSFTMHNNLAIYGDLQVPKPS
jgi:hypothetical protein